ncbi:type III secretion system cytoplasmic ring protein SctQ [Brenneria izbisi]|uniref:Type III secretion system cytoplasmic ring protein SctQ n=1 Tax=Brenneria izbisi TaxID=2939450 RepID=A0AA42C3S1_9GAMM|nr:type III secretion system cytoplasmic ring protein SctQ [Brenneria izbisi]MCV9877539.1 type III secretion system cytoplasmic ring protein SctQ [Brenneria izbisi]MCV9880896.1 type III secretion system cytoplasmic ring protein SctQ [Brenneria izbisi]
MSIQPLTLPTMSVGQAQIRQRLAAGVMLPFSREDQAGTLHLHLAKGQPHAATHGWRCDHGAFALTNPSPVLSLLADCPLLPLDNPSESSQAWYWTLYNQSLSPSIQTLLGDIQPDDTPRIDEDALTGWLTVDWGDIRARSLMVAPSATWLSLLDNPGWRHVHRAIAPQFTVTAPLVLADVVLTAAALRDIRPGDLIVPNRPYFLPSGQGTLVLTPWRLHGTLQLAGLAPYYFTVTDLENIPVNTDFDALTPENHTNTDIDTDTDTDTDIDSDNVTKEPAEHAESAPLPPLPITLHIRCGNVTVPLPTLQRLTSGTVLTLNHTTPGEAWLYHADLPLAQGELVDVEGKLGLQITRLLTGLDVARASQEQQS